MLVITFPGCSRVEVHICSTAQHEVLSNTFCMELLGTISTFISPVHLPESFAYQ
jgi:hypothetical protein